MPCRRGLLQEHVHADGIGLGACLRALASLATVGGRRPSPSVHPAVLWLHVEGVPQPCATWPPRRGRVEHRSPMCRLHNFVLLVSYVTWARGRSKRKKKRLGAKQVRNIKLLILKIYGIFLEFVESVSDFIE